MASDSVVARLAVIGDSHFDETSRFDECVRLHDWIAEDMKSRGVTGVVHTGDVYERRSTPRERAAVAQWVQRVTNFAELLIIRGNHDALGDLPLLSRLRTAHTLNVEEEAGVYEVSGVTVAAMAWPRKAEVLAAAACI